MLIYFHGNSAFSLPNFMAYRASLGTPQKIIYPNCEVFCSASRHNDRRIVNYVTVIATQKLDKR
ncbi:MAG: hypothetical protein BECKG1743D_GA0114223_1002510 [Candidatus Kentron sp. G]|nr:MAG: hypothetical protein BECKG1743F_GA0114225_101376 [Candidatus Kentron sp. G]VFM97707.1 MAG: hypothetical protein BECKG1743D_GA0114223_1002510 [Candidatus Kentron sp. G]VFM98806.1 MAG: hypothetical protein BECKG1743E_GA0114224_102097 [Candidatus Kentron sp. G]